MKIRDLLVGFLKSLGVHRIYGIGGDYAANLICALENDFEIHPCGSEMNAGFSACGDAEVSGIAACLVTYTVGSLPVVSGAGLARAEELPVVFLSGAPGLGEMTGNPLHHMVHSAHDQVVDSDAALKAFSAVGLFSCRLSSERAVSQLRSAYQKLIHAREPVFIEIPRNLYERACEEQVDSVKWLAECEDTVGKQRQVDAALKAADLWVTALSHSRRPLLFFGERIKLSKSFHSMALAFCERHRIPYASNLFAKGILDDFHPLSLGCYNGVFSKSIARQYVDDECDVLLEVGLSELLHDTSSAFGTGTYNIDKITNRITLPSHLLEESALETFFARLEQKTEVIPTFHEAESLLDNLRKGAQQVTESGDKEILHFGNLADVLNEAQCQINKTLVYMPEVGNSYFSSFDLKLRRSELGRSWVTNPWYGAMGTAIPYARAVCREIQRRNLSDVPIVLIGDGGFHFQSNEFIHLLKDNAFLVVLYFRNGLFHLGKSSNCAIYACSDERFDLGALAQAYQGSHRKIENAGGLKNVLKDLAMLGKGLHFIEVEMSIEKGEQSKPIQLLNLYIQARSGNLESQREWALIE